MINNNTMKDKSKMSNIPNVISAKAILLKERRLVLNVVELDSINGIALDDIINSVGRAIKALGNENIVSIGLSKENYTTLNDSLIHQIEGYKIESWPYFLLNNNSFIVITGSDWPNILY